MTKDEYFKLCTALVQEQVYAWGIASSFVCLGSPPGMADAMLLKPNWSIRYTMYGTRNVFTPQLSPFREIAAEAQDYLSDFNYIISWVSPLTE